MEQEPRKATEVLLDLEKKIDILLGTIRAQDLNIKVLSNKLSEVMQKLDKQQAVPGKITVEAVQSVPPIFAQIPVADPERAIPVSAESKLAIDEGPQGFRRTSRPESYAGDDAYIRKENVPPPRQPGMSNLNMNPPSGRSASDVSVIQQSFPPQQQKQVAHQQSHQQLPHPTLKGTTSVDPNGTIPVEQRVVDRNGKSIFLADVEIVDLATGGQVSKSRTNGTGKWMAALPLGEYRVTIRKLESLTREKVEAVQTIKVDGTESPLKLQMVILK
jgi:hypothetical protein